MNGRDGAISTPQLERTVLWSDTDVGVRWPLAGTPILSDKDRAGRPLRAVALEAAA